jgi:hypothetical protein
MFNEVPHPLTLWDSKSFKQELALLLRVNLNALCRDVESLPVGDQVHILVFIAFVDQDNPSTLIVHML